MPNISLTIPNVTQSVDRPVVMDIVNKVKEILKITPEAETYFFSDEGYASAAGSTLSNTERTPRFATNRMVMLDVERSPNIDNLVTSVSQQTEHIPVLEDESLGFLIRPIFESTDIRLNFRYRTTSKEEAKRWRDDIAIRVTSLRDMFVHTIQFHYNLPKQAWDLVSEIYSLREAQAGYNQSFEEYVYACTRGQLSLIAEGTGQYRLPVIPLKQGRIIGMFDFVPLPDKATYEEQTGTYLNTFTYKFTFDSPVGVNIVYPLMVHNQYLPDKWIEFSGKLPSPTFTEKIFSESFYAFRHFESDVDLIPVTPDEPYIRIPHIDEFTPRMTHAGTGTFLLTMVQLENAQDKLLFNLRELGDVDLDAELLRFLEEGEWYYASMLYKSIIHVSLYNEQSLCNPDRIQMDSALNVSTSYPLDLRKTFHVRMSLVTDLTLLDPAALDRLRKYPKLFVLYFTTINRMLALRADFQRLGIAPRISPTQVKLLTKMLTGVGGMNEWINLTKTGDLFQDLDWPSVMQWYHHRQRLKTVATVGIIAHRRKRITN